MNRSALRRLALPAVAPGIATSSAASGHATPKSVGFTQPQYVDTVLAGGEPIIMANPPRGTLVRPADLHAPERRARALG